MLLRVPMQSDNSFSMVRPLVRSRASLLFENSVWVSLQSEFSNDQVENSALLSKRLRNRRDIGSKDTAVALCGM
jgi:hypothetical protein